MNLVSRRYHLFALALAALLCAAAAAPARPDRAARRKLCDQMKSDPKHRCYPKAEPTPEKDRPLSLRYGWAMGAGHPASVTDPPGYDLLLNGLDQCAWFHDRGAWRWNPRSRSCEDQTQCSNTLGLVRCLGAYQPEGTEGAAARKLALRSIGRIGDVCLTKLYKEYGTRFARDEHGSQWLSPASVQELAQALAQCPATMPTPGWDQAAALQGQQK
jgi:hypothetical protein